MKHAHMLLDLEKYWLAYTELKTNNLTQVQTAKNHGLNQSTLSRLSRLVLIFGEETLSEICNEGTTIVDGVKFTTLSSLYAYKDVAVLNQEEGSHLFGRGDKKKFEDLKKEKESNSKALVPITNNANLFLAIELLKENGDLNTLKKIYDDIKKHFSEML